MTIPHTDFMHDLDKAITQEIARAAQAHAFDDELIPSILTVLSRLSASLAIEYGLTEQAFAIGMVATYRKVQQSNATIAAEEAIAKAAGTGRG